MGREAANDNRDCWKSTREKERRKARFSIRERVAKTSTCITSDDPGHCTKLPLSATSASDNAIECEQDWCFQNTWDRILPKIHATDRSAFSVTYFANNFEILSQSVPTSYLRTQLPEQLVVSFFGHDYYQQLKEYVRSMESISLLEFTSLLGRFVILSSFLSGGINPCCRGVLILSDSASKSNHNYAQFQGKLLEAGRRVMQKFFNWFPLPLATYIVKRVVDMRMESVLQRASSRSPAAGSSRNNKQCHDTFLCDLCNQTYFTNFQLIFGPGAITPAETTRYTFCQHSFCELCFWEDLLQNVDTRLEGNVVSCPCCGLASPDFFVDEKDGRFKLVETSPRPKTTQLARKEETPQRRYQQSKARYEALPADTAALKNFSGKKIKASKSQYMCTTWSQAVKPSLGLCRSVRREKFFAHAENGSVPYVQGCLEAGVDANLQNEYGQTVLYLSTWSGNTGLVNLLLEYGADPTIPANGGLTVAGVCRANGCWQVLELLQQHGYCRGEEGTGANFSITLDTSMETPQVECLIEATLDHPGAGSYTVSHIISSVEPLEELWKRLPVEQISVKKKKGMCSDRSYFCDAEGGLRSYLTDRLMEAFDRHFECQGSTSKRLQNGREVMVFPHMRFLHYSQQGLSLAPHVDLCRVDSSGRRSTHSFLLYLSDCDHGGETVLLGGLSGEGLDVVLASVAPRRGMLLIFPHNCPHLGAEVRDVPKLLIRGEILLNLGVLD